MSGPIPAGFKPFTTAGAFVETCGPFYYRKQENGGYRYGFAAEPRHANPYGVIHGGVLITFADTFMGRVVVAAANCACATITLNTEFVSGASAGSWIEGRAEIVRMTSALAFVRADLLAEDDVVLTASGIWRLFPGRSPRDGARLSAGPSKNRGSQR